MIVVDCWTEGRSEAVGILKTHPDFSNSDLSMFDAFEAEGITTFKAFG